MPTFTRQFESRAMPKVASAARHFTVVEQEAVNWVRSVQPLAMHMRISAVSPNVLEFFEPDDFDPPLQNWTDEFSAGVHDLRSALDALALEIAYIDNGTVPNESDIAFPIVYRQDDPIVQENKWKNSRAVRALSRSTPASLMSRFRGCQTWQDPDTYTEDLLEVLAIIDNEDKHRFGSQINLIPSRWNGFPSFAWVDCLDEPAFDRPWLQISYDQTHTPCHAVVDLQDNIIPMVSFGNHSAHLFDLQTSLFADVQRLIQYILSGTWSEKTTLVLRGPYPIVKSGGIPNVRRLQFTGTSHPTASA